MNVSIEEIELKLLIEAIVQRYGYDFRDYSEASFRRRVAAAMNKHSIKSLSLLQHELLRSPDFFSQLVSDLTVTTSEMFRDPEFFHALRTEIIPVLKTYPAIKIWHAGCSKGEEVYSLAIILQEEGLLSRTIIYATDINEAALEIAKAGIYPLDAVATYTRNYHKSGGRGNFADYYVASYEAAKFDSNLISNVVFAEHNLATDDVFSEVTLILCRNVLIYFKRPLQNKVFDLFSRSLSYKGFLCLGSKETMRLSPAAKDFESSPSHSSIYRKIVSEKSVILGDET
ncbi:MAG: protein-glutamate O-methyltransferase CheR [Oligoflexales bacterium]